MNAQGKPVLADVEEIHGKDVVKSCDEVAKLRAARRREEEVGALLDFITRSSPGSPTGRSSPCR